MADLRRWAFGEREWELGTFPKLMGIINCTPDSFSDGGQFLNAKIAVEHGLRLVEQGADIIDIGGESTRPGSERVSEAQELSRVIPVIESLAKQIEVPISIDTTKAEVANQAIAAGAEIVNDISGLTFDEKMIPVCAQANVGVICMHIRGTPQTMQDAPEYEDVVRDVCAWLRERARVCTDAGIATQRIVLDPGIGFGKTPQHNLALLSSVEALRAIGRPILIGHSRKRFLKWLLDRQVEERMSGTLGVAIALAAQGTDIIRVHDVQAVRDALVAWKAIIDNE